MSIKVIDARLCTLIREDANVEMIAAGPFTPAEGPVWVRNEKCLVFTDVERSQILRWDEASGVRSMTGDICGACGMTMDGSGRLIVCGGGDGALLRMVEGFEGKTEVIASHYDGKRLNSPNDVVVARDGSIYFTDPWWGWYTNPDRRRELDFAGVFRLNADGVVDLLAGDFDFPNGLCLTPDETVLYVNDTERAHIRALDIAAGGVGANHRIFAADIKDEPALARQHDPMTGDVGSHIDGVKCDEQGNVWTTAPDGLWVFSPHGDHLGVISVPGPTRNIHWGGDDWRTLFIGTLGALYRLETKVPGRPEPFMGRA